MSKPRLTRAELLELPAMTTLETAARALGLGRSKAYDLAKRDEFPCHIIRIGTTYHVPTAGLLDVLGISADATL